MLKELREVQYQAICELQSDILKGMSSLTLMLFNILIVSGFLARTWKEEIVRFDKAKDDVDFSKIDKDAWT